MGAAAHTFCRVKRGMEGISVPHRRAWKETLDVAEVSNQNKLAGDLCDWGAQLPIQETAPKGRQLFLATMGILFCRDRGLAGMRWLHGDHPQLQSSGNSSATCAPRYL